MKYGERSRRVRDIQQTLNERGYPVDVDGILGPQTWAALERMTIDAGRAWAPGVPDAALAEALSRKRLTPVPPAPVPPDVDNARIYDLVREQEAGSPKTRRVAGRTVMRDMHTIDTLVVHQTAVPFGVADYQIHAAHGDRSLAKARRALNVAAHATAFVEGFAALGHDVRAYVNHAGPVNAWTVGLEIEGRYPGLMDDPTTVPDEADATTWGGPPMVLTAKTVAAACAAAACLCANVERAGGKLTTVLAHRQSEATRRADPGEQIWKEVVLGYIVPVLGLKVRSGATYGDGRPIPFQWDVNGAWKY